ncbi:MAG: hypothetical protein IAF94_10190 [Pirellulaceae bacterium]|nr:hypothetical protein [Pirellulaceae bacterium]
MEKTTLSLQASEQALVAAASRLYAAYIVSGQVGEGQEQGWRERAVRETVAIALQVEDTVSADDELRS